MKKYQDRKDKVVFPVTSSYKLDGVFAVVKNGRFCSKNDNEFAAVSDCLAGHGFEDGVEGELYRPLMLFEDIISAVKRDEPNDLTPHIGFYPHRAIYKVESNSHEELDAAMELAVAAGYEGIVITTQGGEMLKYKPFFDEEYIITDAVEGKGKFTGLLGKFICHGIHDNSKTFGVPMNGDYAYLGRLWEDRCTFIGAWVTVRYQNKTKNGIPRFPRGTSIRDYE